MKGIRTSLLVALQLTMLVTTFAQTKSFTRNNNGEWEILFDGSDLTKWKVANTARGKKLTDWKIDQGELFVTPGLSPGDIITHDRYSDFELEFEFSISDSANSGVKYFVTGMTSKNTGSVSPIGLEYQIIDDVNFKGVEANTTTGAVYLLYAPKNKKLLHGQQWNRGRVVSNKNHIEHWLNGTRILSFEKSSAEFRRLVSKTKFKDYPGYGENIDGHILLQDHGGGVRFRNIRIKRL